MAHGVDTAVAPPTSIGGVPESPAAQRIPRRRWRDWKLALGLVMVLGSAAAGAWLLDAADDSVTVWSARQTLVAGTELTQADLVGVDVRLDAATVPYLAGDVPEGYVVTRVVGPGELVPAAAVAPAAATSSHVRHVAVAVSPESLPGRLTPADRVDVWVVPDALSASPETSAELVVRDAPVVSLAAADGGLTASGAESVILVLDADAIGGPDVLEEVTARLVSASAAGTVVLTLNPMTP